MEKLCENCGKPFKVKPSHFQRRKFCSQSCLGIENGKRLQRLREEFASRTGSRTFGKEPWSKVHAKGIHLSPATEFKRGVEPTNKLPIGAVTIRVDKNDKPRAFVKIAEPNVWKSRAILVWESTHGVLPKGQLVHHKDRDSLNDAPENLQVLSRRDHMKEHRQDNEERRLAGLRTAALLRQDQTELA